MGLQIQAFNASTGGEINTALGGTTACDCVQRARHADGVIQKPLAAAPNGWPGLDHSRDYVCLNFSSNLAASMSVRDRGRLRAPEERDERAPFPSIISSAATSRWGGTSRPSALAVLRLTVVSNLVGA